MGLSPRTLADGEEVVYEARPHWIVLARPVSVLVALVAVLVAVVIAFPGAPVAVAEVLAALAVLGALWLAARLVRWRHTIVAVTTLRVLERSGVLSRRGEEIRLDRVAELSYHQSLLGMLLGAGSVVVETGGGAAAVLDAVRHPARLQSLITDQVAAYQRALVAPGGGWGATWADGPGGPSAWEPPVREPAPTEGRSPAQWSSPPAQWSSPATGWSAGVGWSTPPAGTPAVVATDPSSRWDDATGGVNGRGEDATGGGNGRWDDATGVARGRWDDVPAATAGQAGSSVADRLATLADLHRRGLVTDHEYATTRARLLDQL